MPWDFETLHQQETDFEIIKLLLPHIRNHTFLDIGAEKGTFTELLTSHNFTGIFFEPLPKHESILRKLAHKTQSIFSTYAIDNKDGEANFHIACDENGEPLDYFHSLQPLENDSRIHHNKSITVTCRSLNSLYQDGTISNQQIGIIKTDTEGNDLHVLQGMSQLAPELIVCEYFMPGIYNGWEQGNAYKLIEEAKKLGFDHYISIKRINVFETISVDTTTFLDKQWGNLIFLKTDLFNTVKTKLDNLIEMKGVELINKFLSKTTELEAEITTLRQTCNERDTLIKSLHKSCDERLKLINKLNSSLVKKSPKKELIPAPTKSERNDLLAHIEQQEKTIQNLKTMNTAREVDFLADINTHFSEIYTRFTEIQQQIIQTSKNEIGSLKQKYKELQQEKINLIEPLKKDLFEQHHNKSWLDRAGSRIKIFFTPKLGALNLYPARPLTIPKRYKKINTYDSLPAISIVTPSFNHGTFLERTIKSILDQKYPRLEYVIQDGNSNDETSEILQQYQSSLAHCESIQDNGQSHAINLGFRHTTGDIMAYLNSDDMLVPGALHYVGEYFAKHPEVDVIYGHRILIDEDDHEIGRWILPKHDTEILSWADYIPQETLFWRRSLWEKVGGKIDESFRFAMDWDLILRFRETGATFVRLPRFLGMFRIHPHQKTSSQISHVGIEEMQRLRKRCHKRAISLEEIAKSTRSYLNRHLIYHKLYKAGILRY